MKHDNLLHSFICLLSEGRRDLLDQRLVGSEESHRRLLCVPQHMLHLFLFLLSISNTTRMCWGAGGRDLVADVKVSFVFFRLFLM